VARSTGPVLLAGGLAAANEALFAPLAAHKAPDWAATFRLLPVTAGLALGLALLERAAPQFAVGLGWLLVAGVFVFSPTGGPAVLTNVNKVLKV
jgi:hypothetical protein